MNNNEQFIRTRFAPSPTGDSHVGGIRTALYNYLLSKNKKGLFIFRVEDTDKERSLDKYVNSQYEDLCWLGLFPDESIFTGGNYGPYQQKKRLSIYKYYLDYLISKKKAYYCFCTKEELSKEKSDYICGKNKKNYKYSRKCFFLTNEEITLKLKLKQNYLVRFFVEESETYKFKDMIRGEVSFSSDDIGDFVICRSNGLPLLNFAIVIDDYLMKITHVLRAEEHLTNTSKQLAIYRFFGWNHPNFAHLSIIINSKKKKISKRDENSEFYSINSLKKLGYLPESIINYLVFLGWNPKSKNEFFSLEELIKIFDISRLNSSPSMFSIEKLNWFNNYWIRRLDNKRYHDLSWEYIKELSFLINEEKEHVLEISNLFKNQLNCFSDLNYLIKPFFEIEDFNFDFDKDSLNMIKNFFSEIIKIENWSEKSLKESLNFITLSIDKEKKKNFFLNLRTIITGNQKGPELHKIINLIGKLEIKKRLNNFFK